MPATGLLKNCEVEQNYSSEKYVRLQLFFFF